MRGREAIDMRRQHEIQERKGRKEHLVRNTAASPDPLLTSWASALALVLELFALVSLANVINS